MEGKEAKARISREFHGRYVYGGGMGYRGYHTKYWCDLEKSHVNQAVEDAHGVSIETRRYIDSAWNGVKGFPCWLLSDARHGF
jgi:hypothetical protein